MSDMVHSTKAGLGREGTFVVFNQIEEPVD